ncbi:energy transducer TonB [Hymenobacter sediminis]|uniref:energy transducer TonB n=1 Tax=Hymenobacter sediminis TaxID=2218621 RepID=UPI0013903B87|nr:energy transducer TonB [Hymenobacter sediminis]
MPVFKGSQQSLKRFLDRASHWPDSLSRTIAGQVYVEFMINELGQVRNASVVRSFHPLASTEALRLVQLLDGRFTPGRVNGQPVAMKLTLPISFGTQPVSIRKQL